MKKKTVDIIFLLLALWTIFSLADFLFVPRGYGINENSIFNLSGLFTGLILIIGQIVRWIKLWANLRKGIKDKITIFGIIVSVFTMLSFSFIFIMVFYLFNAGPK